jgi:hypothetical protein
VEANTTTNQEEDYYNDNLARTNQQHRCSSQSQAKEEQKEL